MSTPRTLADLRALAPQLLADQTDARRHMAGAYLAKSLRSLDRRDYAGARADLVEAAHRMPALAQALPAIDAAERGSIRSPARAAASRANGASGGRPVKPAGESHVWTAREVVALIPNGYTSPAGRGVFVRAVCCPSDEDDGTDAAQFDVRPSWADTIGPRDNADAAVEALVRRIEAKFPSPRGWSYDAANGTIDQVATFGRGGWAPTAGL